MPEEKLPPILMAMLAGDGKFIEHLLKAKPSTLIKMLTDKKLKQDHRRQLMQHILLEHPDLGQNLLETLVAAASNDEAVAAAQKAQELQQQIEAMEMGPLRYGRFVCMIDEAGAVPRAHVVLHDGATAYSPVPKPQLVKQLRRGDGVLLDAQGRAVLYRIPAPPETGEQGTLERVMGHGNVLVSFRHEERRVMYATQALLDAIEADEVRPGAALLVSSRQNFANAALPIDETLSHYRYMDHAAAPSDVQMGCPPAYVSDFGRHLRMTLGEDELLDKWKRPRSKFALLEGVTGTGKTLSVYLLWQRMAQLTADAAGVELKHSPLKVFRLRPSDSLSKWLGESDQNIARFFKEMEQYASQPLKLADGRTLPGTPCIGVIEELDGLARSRENSDAIYGRIMVTLLQYMDQTRPELARLPMYICSTTNIIGQVDAAAVRRCGGRIIKFHHLTRSAFLGVVNKHLADLTLSPRDGVDDPNDLRRAFATDLANWLYTRNGQGDGLVEVTYANARPETKYRRHFLTGALVARAVSDAADDGCAREYDGEEGVALTVDDLMAAFDAQINAMADQLSKFNAASFIELREGGHISDVNRLRRPTIHPYQLRQAE